MMNTQSRTITDLRAVFRTILFGCSLLLLICGKTFAQATVAKAVVNKEKAAADNKASATTKPGCNYTKKEVDQAKGRVLKMMQQEQLIKHTPEEMKEVFKESDFITMKAYLNNFNNSIALLLKITIQTNNPKDMYGAIFKDNKLLLKLANGENITLVSGQSDAGNVDLAHARTSYMTFFPLDEATMEKLQSTEVTKARLHWAKGYEDYEVAVPDFFIRQLSCVR